MLDASFGADALGAARDGAGLSDAMGDAMGSTSDSRRDSGSSMSCARPGATLSDSPTLKATGFTGGAIAPFMVCTTQNPNYGQAFTLGGEPCMKFFWTQVGYNGTRERRGAEACSNLQIYKEGWYGFKFYLPSPGFPTNKVQGIGQIFSNGGCSSWAALLEMRNNDLWITYRGNCASPAQYEVMLASGISRNTWHPIVLHFIVSSQNSGGIELWFGDAVCNRDVPTHRKLGINFGFGTFTQDTLSAISNNAIGLKFGMYNFDDGNYTAGETRTIYYDDVRQFDGTSADGWDAVNPGN